MEHHLWIDYDKEKKSVNSSPDDCRYNLCLRFCCEPSFENRIIRQYSEPLIQRTNLPLIVSGVLLSTLDGEEKGREIIERELRDWPVQPEARRWLIDHAMKDVRELFQCMPPHDNTLFLNFRVRANHVSVYYEQEKQEIVNSMEEKKKKKTNNIMDCSICLDDILIGAKALPCCHVFHKDCINKWLKKSHSCPVCRYKMPARV
ncbi:hypothetical protein CASFOL_012766 [Castilleja foliolosa]|uniref:RING-type E3 ubiquitin transferase n=1 Tax=Castilleja foliolosa TaxID=1961234 RepID=A0ABD3DLT0_9LAMI